MRTICAAPVAYQGFIRRLSACNIIVEIEYSCICRKSLYVWNIETTELQKMLDAHFGRIISLEPLTIGNWNSVS